MKTNDFKRIEKNLDINLPQNYKDILVNYPESIQKASVLQLFNNATWVIKQNKLVRKAPTRFCRKEAWLPHHFVIGEDSNGNRYYLDLQQSPSPIYLFDHKCPNDETKQVAPNLEAWLPIIKQEFKTKYPYGIDESWRCPRCMLARGREVVQRKKSGTKILKDTRRETTYRINASTYNKCKFCNSRWTKNESRTYKDIEM